MRALDQNKIRAALLAFALLFVCSAAGIAFLVWRQDHPAQLDRPASKISVSADGAALFSDGEFARAIPAGAGTLTVQNRGETDARLTFYFSAPVKIDGADHAAYAPVQADVPKDAGVTLSFFAAQETAFGFSEAGLHFVFNADSLEAALSRAEPGDAVSFIRKTDLGALSLSIPLRLFGDFTFDRLTLQSALPGTAAISPDDPFAASVSVFAPNADLYTKNIEFSFDPELADYYLKVKTLNGEKRDLARIPVADHEMLAGLSENAVFLSDGLDHTVQVVRPFSLKEDLSFDRVFSLTLSAPLDAAGRVLSMKTGEETALTVSVGEGIAFAPEALRLNAPLADLTWDSANPPVLERVESVQNLRSYNGTPCRIGGEGDGTARIVLEAAFCAEPVVFEREGNLLVAALPFSVKSEDLTAVTPRVESDCRAYFADSDGSGAVDLAASPILVLEDAAGKTLRLRVQIRREAKNLPVLYIQTENGAEVETKEQYVSATFYMDGGTSGFETVPLTHIRIRGRGNSTWEWPKKPYKIHFDEPVSVFGLAAAEEWALLANYADKSLMRNHVALEMARELSFDYTPTQNTVDVFFNGDYIGVYSFGEHLEEGEGRVEVAHDPGKVDCGYFLEVGGVVSGVDVLGKNYFHAGLLKFILVKGPGYEELTKEQFDYIKEYCAAADKAVKAHEGYEEYLDVDSVIDWLIMIELTNNIDCSYRRSCYLTKEPGGKLKMGPVWDFDLALGNFSRDDPDYSVWASYNMDNDDYVGETWTYHLFQDPAFKARFKARWQEVRDRLVETALCAIDEEYRRIQPSAEENFAVWDILGRKVAFEPKSTSRYLTYESQITYLKNFLKKRAAWIDTQVVDW